MTRSEVERFLNGDCFVKYDGELYYFDSTGDDGTLTMREINTDYAHIVAHWYTKLRTSGLYHSHKIC